MWFIKVLSVVLFFFLVPKDLKKNRQQEDTQASTRAVEMKTGVVLQRLDVNR